MTSRMPEKCTHMSQCVAMVMNARRTEEDRPRNSSIYCRRQREWAGVTRPAVERMDCGKGSCSYGCLTTQCGQSLVTRMSTGRTNSHVATAPFAMCTGVAGSIQGEQFRVQDA